LFNLVFSIDEWYHIAGLKETIRVIKMKLEPQLADITLFYAKSEMDKIRLQFKRIRQDKTILNDLNKVTREYWKNPKYQKAGARAWLDHADSCLQGAPES